jgi:Glycosyltransferase family 25 (LPS biosynthesis protein)
MASILSNTRRFLSPRVRHTIHQGRRYVSDPRARAQAEKASPSFNTFGGIMCLNLDRQPERWTRMVARFEQLGIAGQVRRIPAVDTPDNHHIGCALSHRRALELARQENLHSVLILEDDAVFLQGATWVLRRSLRELERQNWKLFYLGTLDGVSQFPLVGDCAYLEAVRELTAAHAVAYHHRLYDHLLAELPADVAGMRAWIERHQAIDKYLAFTVTTGAFRVRPMVAVQEGWLKFAEEDLRDQFVIDPAP